MVHLPLKETSNTVLHAMIQLSPFFKTNSCINSRGVGCIVIRL